MNFEEEYQYRVVTGQSTGSGITGWRRVDEVLEPSLLDTIAESQPNPLSNQESGLVPDSLFLDRLLQDDFKVGLISRQIQEREKLKARHLENIERSISYCNAKIDWLDSVHYGRTLALDKSRDMFASQVFQLEHQGRQEENASWKDQTMLLKDFFEAWSGYRADLWTYSVLNPENSR